MNTRRDADRQSSEKTTPRKRRVKSENAASINVVDLIDTAFSKKLTVVENGKPQRRTVLQEIYRQLWKKEMDGDLHAMRVRLAYEKFVLEQTPKQEQEIIVIGGLP